ncbi:hypothetical protein SCP_1201640 [Sparassis crispa]|uniref:Uncharacterized protein n=1 Tax=Sparassis crispa TaxID=139825 RepID=A0A401H0J2_9APHY|nr:hypothetical protein SCP_1201640 [Sparassis crispa]GBE87938.1 hypothetical protein SCP_1201640 [Sparassis crispa]
MFPQFSNPHTLSQATKRVDRLALEDNDHPPSYEGAERTEMIAQLEGLLKRSFGNLTTSPRDQEHDTPRRKKRRIGADDVHLSESSPLPFRLVSRALPPKSILLKPKPPPAIVVQEPSCEDDEIEAERRRAQAQAVAVDFDWVMAESKQTYLPSKNDHKKVIHVQAQLATPEPIMMVVEREKPPPRKPKLALSLPPADFQPSPHSLPAQGVLCPVVDVTTPGLPEPKRKRCRKPHVPRPRPPAMFWRPFHGMGGKSAGYAMGYEGSWPVHENDPRCYTYQRDTMRRGSLMQSYF